MSIALHVTKKLANGNWTWLAKRNPQSRVHCAGEKKIGTDYRAWPQIALG